MTFDPAWLGYLSAIWCVGQLVWGIFRNDAMRTMIYGIATFAAVIIALNIGGVLNDETWSLFGLAVFGAHTAYALLITKVPWQIAIYSVLTATSLASIIGVF